MTKKIISTLALGLLLTVGASHAFASEVTGGLTTAGVSRPSTNTTGALTGTVSSPTSGGSGGTVTSSGGGSGGIIGLIGSSGNGPLASAVLVIPPQNGQVLGATTVTPSGATSGHVDTSGTEPEFVGDPVALTDTGVGLTPPPLAPLAAATTAGIDSWMWLLIVLIILAVGYYAYDRYNRRNRRLS